MSLSRRPEKVTGATVAVSGTFERLRAVIATRFSCFSLSVSVQAAQPFEHFFCCLCREEVVQVLSSNTVEEMDANVERIVLWVKQFMALR